jgi:hypothetical protein
VFYTNGLQNNDNVWVAHSMYHKTVGHLKTDGTWVGVVSVGKVPLRYCIFPFIFDLCVP